MKIIPLFETTDYLSIYVFELKKKCDPYVNM